MQQVDDGESGGTERCYLRTLKKINSTIAACKLFILMNWSCKGRSDDDGFSLPFIQLLGSPRPNSDLFRLAFLRAQFDTEAQRSV